MLNSLRVADKVNIDVLSQWGGEHSLLRAGVRLIEKFDTDALSHGEGIAAC